MLENEQNVRAKEVRTKRSLNKAKGLIKLTVETDKAPRWTKLNVKFMVVDSTSPFNAIMGQPMLFSLRAIVSL